MKKIFIGFFALLMSASLMAERVSQEDAALVANHFMNGASSASDAQKAPQKRMVLKKAASATDNQYYIYENANGEGWVIVAANDIVTPVLAYSNTGSFRTDNMPKNISNWMSKYDHFILKLEADGVVASEETKAQWTNLRKASAPQAKAAAVVGPLIQTKWDQDAPYNDLCPGTGTWGKNSTKAATGCAATALAQVMKYWEWPVKGTGSHSYQPLDPNSTTGAQSKRYGVQSADFGNTTYDWANMLNKYSGSTTSAQKNAVATLMYHCGVAMEMMYGNNDDGGSGAYTANYGIWDSEEFPCSQNALVTYFGYPQEGLVSYMRDGYTEQGYKYYDSWTDAEWTAMVKAELDLKRPILYAGEGDEGGHSFICDGYDTSNKFHFNWGWSGDCDGYFTLSSLNPGGDGIGGGGYDFSEGQEVIIGIRRPGKDVNVSWYADGILFDETVATGGSLTLPASTPEDCQNGKVFVGWTEEDSYEGDEAPALVKAGAFLEEDATFYAVYATAEGGSGTKTVTYTGSDLFSNQEPAGTKTIEGVTFAFDKGANASGNEPKYYDKGTSVRMYADNTLTISAETEISAVQFTFGSTTTAGLTASEGTLSGNAWSGNSKSIVFTTGSTGQQHIMNIVVTVGGGVTYSAYATTCSGEAPEPVYYSIRFFSNGAQIGETQTVLKGQQAEVPEDPTPLCDDYTFAGWWNAELAADNKEAKTWITNFKATKDQDYYAIYSRTEESEGGSAAFDGETAGTYKIYAQVGDTKYFAKGIEAITNSNKKITSTTDESEAFEYVFAKVEGGFSIKNGEQYLSYGTSGTNIGTSADPYTWTIASGVKGTWRVNATTGSNRALAFRAGESNVFGPYSTTNITANGNEYFDLEIVGEGVSSTTYYTSTLNCSGSAIENTAVEQKAVKMIYNGQVVIVRDGVRYNMLGQTIE